MRGCIALVETQEAIALGESVQPLTKITPNVSITVIVNGKFVVNCVMKSENVIVMIFSFIKFGYKYIKYYIMNNVGFEWGSIKFLTSENN